MTALVNDIDNQEIEKEVNSSTANDNTSTQNSEPLDDKEKNWRAFLEKRKEDQKALEDERKRNQELESQNARRAKEIEDLKLAFQAMAEKKDNNYDDDNSDDPKKAIQDEVNRILSQKEAERDQRDRQERIRKETLEIKEQMPDLVEVCSHDNLAYLEYYHPEIAIPLAKMPDGLEKTKLAYQAVKKHVKMNKKEQNKIEQNLSKPKSLHSSLSNESQKEESSAVMSDKRKTETWQKMQRLMSGEDED